MEANAIVLDDTAGDVIVVVVEGEHDIYTAPTLRERLDEALSRGVCVGDTVEPGVQRILDITGLVPVLPVMRGRDEAIQAARTDGSSEGDG